MKKDEILRLIDTLNIDDIVEFKIEYTDFSSDNRVKTITFEK